MLLAIFGVLAIAIGLAIIAWIGYNEFVERLPQYTGFHWWEPFGMAPGPGQHWLRSLRPRSRYSGGLHPPA